MKIILFILFAAVSAVPSNGQRFFKKILITGYVVDGDQYPVGGAIIVIDKDKTHVFTDEKGYYKVRVSPNTITVGVFSFLHGMIEEPVNGRTRINFEFPGSTPDQEVTREPIEVKDEVNIGYGKVDRRNLTSTVNKIDGTDNRFTSYNSIYDMLQGSVPGVMVHKGNVRIRGITSFRLSNEPLFVVDGVPVSSIADIPPQMVKSIEVLKGSASAIYGSRGSNGAILIDLKGAPDPQPVVAAPHPGKVPFAVTDPASNVLANSATLNGTVNPNYLPTTVTFEYGTNTGYGSSVAASQSPVNGNTSGPVSFDVTGLKPGITYHYRVVATNSLGTTIGIDVPFTSFGKAPSAMTRAATETTPATVRLNGLVNAGYLPTVVTFEYGPTTAYGDSVTVSPAPLTGSTTGPVSSIVTNLKAGTTYHYRIVARNDQGTTYGDDMTFRSEYVIGEQMYGGIIFYIDKTGEHGLVCTTYDQSNNALWGKCIPSGAAGRAIGTGYQNTADIVTGCPDEGIAARLCNDLVIDGYSDWFLPSIDELYLMYSNLHEKGLGGFERSYYWSSTQDRHGAWVVSFFYGSKSNHSRDEQSIRIRAVRAF